MCPLWHHLHHSLQWIQWTASPYPSVMKLRRCGIIFWFIYCSLLYKYMLVISILDKWMDLTLTFICLSCSKPVIPVHTVNMYLSHVTSTASVAGWEFCGLVVVLRLPHNMCKSGVSWKSSLGLPPSTAEVCEALKLQDLTTDGYWEVSSDSCLTARVLHSLESPFTSNNRGPRPEL